MLIFLIFNFFKLIELQLQDLVHVPPPPLALPAAIHVPLLLPPPSSALIFIFYFKLIELQLQSAVVDTPSS